MNFLKKIIYLALSAAWLLSACSPGAPAEVKPGAVTVTEQAAQTEPPAPTAALAEATVEEAPATTVVETPTEAPRPATQAAGVPTAAAGQPEVAACPDRGAELEATNPADVQLASGKLQLVEFFAFW
jgi:hypothetical protein